VAQTPTIFLFLSILLFSMSTPINIVFFGIACGGLGIHNVVPIFEAIWVRTFPQMA